MPNTIHYLKLILQHTEGIKVTGKVSFLKPTLQLLPTTHCSLAYLHQGHWLPLEEDSNLVFCSTPVLQIENVTAAKQKKINKSDKKPEWNLMITFITTYFSSGEGHWTHGRKKQANLRKCEVKDECAIKQIYA